MNVRLLEATKEINSMEKKEGKKYVGYGYHGGGRPKNKIRNIKVWGTISQSVYDKLVVYADEEKIPVAKAVAKIVMNFFNDEK